MVLYGLGIRFDNTWFSRRAGARIFRTQMGEAAPSASAIQAALHSQQQALETQQMVTASLESIVTNLLHACAPPQEGAADNFRTQVIGQLQLLQQLLTQQQMACQMQTQAIGQQCNAAAALPLTADPQIQLASSSLAPAVEAPSPSQAPPQLQPQPQPQPQLPLQPPSLPQQLPLGSQPLQLPAQLPQSMQQQVLQTQPESDFPEKRHASGQPKSQMLQDPGRWKTVMCKSFDTPAGCRFGDQCNFAHGADELRPKSTATVSTSVPGVTAAPPFMAFDACASYGAGYDMSYGAACNSAFQGGMVGSLPSPLGAAMPTFAPPTGPPMMTNSLHAPSAGGMLMGYSNALPPGYSLEPPLKRHASGQPKSQMLQDPGRWKTVMCKAFDTPAGCRFGDQCNFAHGAYELRPKGA